VAKALRECAPWKALPADIAPWVAPFLNESGLVEEYEHRAAEMQRQLDNFYATQGVELGQGPLQGLNGGLVLPGLEPDRMDLLPLRTLLRDATYAHWPDLAVLHPRRRLWCWYEALFIWFYDPDTNCGHCLQLAIDAVGAATEDELWELCDDDDEALIPNYQNKPTDLLELAYPDPYEYGDDPPYYSSLSFQGGDGIKGNLCWRFFVSSCQLCGYQVAPCKAACKCHCLACHYFQRVLNELFTRGDPANIGGGESIQ
jgi:hypothetical protein